MSEDRVSFEVAPAREYPGTGYDLVAFFDWLHDMGDPAGAARHVLGSLVPDGTWLIIEPFATDDTASNLNSDRVGVLLRIHAGLHPDVAVAGSWRRSRRPGRRGHACLEPRSTWYLDPAREQVSAVPCLTAT
jgi:hypothetical protein